MSVTLNILQLNVRKQSMVQQSLLNDKELQHFSVLAISEPHVWKQDETLVTVPTGHVNWTKMVPTTQHKGRWPVRSMLWVRKDIDAEQIAIQSADITAVVIRLPVRAIFVASVYVEGQNEEALQSMLGLLHQAIQGTRNNIGSQTDVILVGDFNRHNQLWGGNHVSPARQGEADPIIEFMVDYSLQSLLPRGTKTWQRGDIESTIDLALASEALASTLVSCKIHETEPAYIQGI